MLNLIAWVKTNAGQGSFYRSQHELIGVFRVGDTPHLNTIELGRHGRNRSNVWQYAGANTFRAGRLDDLRAHPTVKPVAMIADALKDCTRRNEIVLDTFCGSGATLLAAERVGRRGYGLEIDPRFVDVAVRRWQTATARDAVHAVSGLTFEEVGQQRAGKITPAQVRAVIIMARPPASNAEGQSPGRRSESRPLSSLCGHVRRPRRHDGRGLRGWLRPSAVSEPLQARAIRQSQRAGEAVPQYAHDYAAGSQRGHADP